ncbi:hypothetical protein TrLO_g4999 [Triparma laevis f. longispina]|uniref:Uncharacterized protein n=1 Tax=Triparma laevis f. longispina TaxID=1714387 RepID=A0A9W7E9E1_9STRA|nr:hypothetical protein TrLO_g4999 [Triparma laevis f. longispina]
MQNSTHTDIKMAIKNPLIDTAGVKTATSSQEDQLEEGEGNRPSRTSPGGGEANNAGTRPMFTTGSSA